MHSIAILIGRLLCTVLTVVQDYSSVSGETVWSHPLQWLAAQQCVEACSRFPYLSSVTVTPSCLVSVQLLLLNRSVSLQVQRSLLPTFPVCPVFYQSWPDWKCSGHAPLLSAVRLSSACTDESPWHCMQNSMVWGLTCITLNLRFLLWIHWKLITIHGRYPV